MMCAAKAGDSVRRKLHFVGGAVLRREEPDHRLYRIFFKTYTEKVGGVPCREISADWAAQRIKNLSLREALLNAFLGQDRQGRNGQVITSLIDEFRYPRLGPGMMWERCRDLLDDQGNETRLNSPVRRVEHDGQRVHRVVAETGEGTEEVFSADNFISSMPLRELIRSLDPAPPTAVLEAAAALRYRDYSPWC